MNVPKSRIWATNEETMLKHIRFNLEEKLEGKFVAAFIIALFLSTKNQNEKVKTVYYTQIFWNIIFPVVQ